MPIYEYACASCGLEFEAIQKFSDKPLTRCTCGKSGKVQRKLSLSAFQLKGGGWYKDLYGGGSNGSTAESKSNGAKASEGGGEAKAGDAKSGESKGETKAGESKPAEGSKSTSSSESGKSSTKSVAKEGGKSGGKSGGTSAPAGA